MTEKLNNSSQLSSQHSTPSDQLTHSLKTTKEKSDFGYAKRSITGRGEEEEWLCLRKRLLRCGLIIIIYVTVVLWSCGAVRGGNEYTR